MAYIKNMVRAALPDKLLTLIRKGRRIAASHIDFRSARKALLRSDALSKDEKYLLRNVSLRVSPKDDIYSPGRERDYLSIGLTSLRCINAALAHAPHPVRTILDLPSGYGRILRFLKVSFPRATICGCDIVPEAVEFCRREFNVEACISNQDFAKVSLPGPFDLIWSGSLLTHLDECQATELLRLYHRNLAQGGLCVFTMHGSFSAGRLRSGAGTYGLTEVSRQKVLSEFDNRGYGYADYQPGSGYGISVATRARIVEMASAAGNWTFSSFFERAWIDHHDVYGFTKGQTKAPLIVEARGPAPAVSNFFSWNYKSDPCPVDPRLPGPFKA
jgi:SAM-dependent methyltransferase